MREELIAAAAKAIQKARCDGREGPFGGYDYGYRRGEPVEGGRYVVRDFRDTGSKDWGKWLHQTDDRKEHERVFAKMTEEHIATAALDAILAGLDDPSEEMRYSALNRGALEGVDNEQAREIWQAMLKPLKGE